MTNVKMRHLLVAAVLSALTGLGCPATAIERTPLPEFGLTALDGSAVKSDQLPQAGNWLLIYGQPQCSGCDAVLKVVQTAQRAGPTGKIVVVVAGSAEDVKSVKDGYPDLAGAWYADPDMVAFKQLKLAGVPVTLGVRQNIIEWSIAGILGNEDQLKSILTSWLER